MFFTEVWKKWGAKLSFVGSRIAVFLILFYRSFISGTLACGGGCRFYPSCSEYALLVYKKFSFLKASGLLLKRLFLCQPFGPKSRWEPELSEED